MSWFGELFSGKKASQPFVNYYEAAQNSPDRSTLLTTWQDPDRDMTPAVRQALGRKGRYLVRNSPLFAGIVERMVTYVVGQGIHPEPTTTTPEWNLKCQTAWDKHKNNLILDALFSWDEAVAIIYESILVENGCYSILTFDPSNVQPRIQLVESHRVSGFTLGDLDDGITRGEDGRPLTYRFLLTKDRRGPATEIEADFVVPHYFPKRPGQLFGLTIFAPALNTAHNVEDLLAIEQKAVKEVCTTTNVVRNAAGEAPAKSLTQTRYQNAPTRDQSATSATEGLAFAQKNFGPTTKYLRKDELFEQHVPERPSPTWTGLMDFLAAMVCMPLGMPPSTLLQKKMGGADVRADRATAARVIERHQRRLAHQLQRIYEHVIESELGTENRPDDWNATEWQYSSAITCDAGRQAQQDREDVAMGTNSLRNFCGANGLGGVLKYLRTRAQDVLLVQRVADETKLLPNQIFNFDYKSQPAVPQALVEQEAGVPGAGQGESQPQEASAT
jgi:hypothetical protein